jgi:repressor LexA
MARPVLTPRQETVLRYIETFIAKQGYVPTLKEMAKALGVASVQAVKDHLTALERKGYLRRAPGRRRAIELLQDRPPLESGIPILGLVPAGRPLLAVENQEGTLTLGPAMLGSGTHFALRVQGDSMINAGIQDGDYVIIRQQDTADPGEIVVALLGDEATVKILRQRGRRLMLEAANPAYAPIDLTDLTRQASASRILGRVVGLYRGLGKSG